MYIKGLQKTTLLDFPSRVACTLFTAGCNLRCPFCHNASLVLGGNDDGKISEEEFLAFLKKRSGILDGVCITGGEPLLQGDIIPFIKEIRSLGFAVKLDTNGFFPDTLQKLIDERLVDYIAMDVKNSPEKYQMTVGVPSSFEKVQRSISLIMASPIEYEFRTTVVHELHTEEDIARLSEVIKGADKYFLQCFKDSGDLIGESLSAPSRQTLENMCQIASQYVRKCEIRGI